MKSKKIRIIAQCIQAAAIIIYFMIMLYLGQDSIMYLIFPYFLSLSLILSLTPFINTVAGERKIRTALGAFAAAAVLAPGIFFLCRGFAARSFFWYYPFIIVLTDAILTLIIMAIFKHRRKI